MGYAMMKYREFTLLVRCENCLRDTSKHIQIPPGDHSPNDIDELLESGFLANLSFDCTSCAYPIGQLIGVKEGSSA